MAVGGNEAVGRRVEARLTTPEAPRPQRVRKPSARVIEAQKALIYHQSQENIEDDAMEREDTVGQQVGQMEGNGTVLAAIMQLTKQMAMMQEQQMKMQEQQMKMQQQLVTMQQEQKETKEQLLETQQQVRTLFEWIKDHAPSWSQQPSTVVSPQLSQTTWPSLPSSGQIRGPAGSPNSSASQPGKSAMPAFSMDLSQVSFRAEDAGALKARFNIAFAAQETIKEVKCTGILRSPGDGHNVKVLFKTQEMVDLVRSHDEWVQKHFHGARLRGEQWYPIKVDRVNRFAVNDGNSWIIRENAAKEIGEENAVEVVKMRWLSGPSTKTYGSIVVYLAKAVDAQALLERQIMDFKGEAGFTGHFERRQLPSRCFKCQQYGHQEARCTHDVVCCRCAEKGHQQPNCSSREMKCAACGGPHMSSDRGCRVYRDLLRKFQGPPQHA